MPENFLSHISDTLRQIDAEGLMKSERAITSPQSGEITVGDRRVINLCANNYLGLADHPDLIRAAKGAMDSHGFGMASVRFICGTQDLHRDLEQRLAAFLRMDDAILFAACFDANGGLFEPLLGPQDAIISDALNHASIIDGVRLCKARRYRFANSDMADLEVQLKAARADGVIFAAASFCDPALLDRPMLRDGAEKHGIPCIAFKYSENSGQFQQFREQAGTFSDSIKLWGGE